jgi:hypothetical protein
MAIDTKKVYQLEIRERDPELVKAFAVAGQGTFSRDQLHKIESHSHIVFALSFGVSVEKAREMLKVGKALLNAGGAAVKIETAGLAHTADTWRKLADSDQLFDLYRSFVILVGAGAGDDYYSCGMHNFGLEDTTVNRGDLDSVEAAKLMNTFNHWRLAENPVIKDRDTFGVAADAPYYRLHKRKCDRFAENDTFHNPFGIWHLEPIRR